MECCIHPDREAQGICVTCGKPYCTDCLVKLDEKNYCKDCLKKKIETESPSSPVRPFQQQQQQQSSDDDLDFSALDLTNIHLAVIAFGLFLVSIVVFAFSGGNFYLGILGLILLLAALGVGFYYALELTQKKERDKGL